jgi:hypothetical protein
MLNTKKARSSKICLSVCFENRARMARIFVFGPTMAQGVPSTAFLGLIAFNLIQGESAAGVRRSRLIETTLKIS